MSASFLNAVDAANRRLAASFAFGVASILAMGCGGTLSTGDSATDGGSGDAASCGQGLSCSCAMSLCQNCLCQGTTPDSGAVNTLNCACEYPWT
jgi:hypothetical protein